MDRSKRHAFRTEVAWNGVPERVTVPYVYECMLERYPE